MDEVKKKFNLTQWGSHTIRSILRWNMKIIKNAPKHFLWSFWRFSVTTIEKYPTSQKNFKVIHQDVPYFPKKIEVICHKVPYTQKNVKVIRQDLPYLPKIFQSNLLRWTLLSKKNSK